MRRRRSGSERSAGSSTATRRAPDRQSSVQLARLSPVNWTVAASARRRDRVELRARAGQQQHAPMVRESARLGWPGPSELADVTCDVEVLFDDVIRVVPGFDLTPYAVVLERSDIAVPDAVAGP